MSGLVTRAGRPRSYRSALPFAVAAAVATANFAWGLGQSSLFLDEGLSWHAASAPLSQLLSRIRGHEISPPGYYLALHEWIGRLDVHEEWLLRVPSVAAALALVAAITWLAWRTAGRRAAALAAFIAALSPFVLEYAQQARGYVFAALAATISAAAALEATRHGGVRRNGWLAITAAVAVLGIWIHYTVALSSIVIVVFLWRSLGARIAASIGMVVALLTAPLVPLLREQLASGQQAGIATAARLSIEHVLAVVGAPVYDRTAAMSGWFLVAALLILVLGTIGIMRLGPGPERLLILAGAAVAPLATVAVSALADDVLLPRYCAVSVPFAIAAAAAGLARIGKRGALVLAVILAVALLHGDVTSRRIGGRYADLRGAFTWAGSRWRSTDFMVTAGYATYPDSLAYYTTTRLPAGATVVSFRSVSAGAWAAAASADRRAWLLTDPGNRRALEAVLLRIGYRVISVRVFGGRNRLQLATAVPVE